MRILLCFDTDGTFWTDEDNSEYICGMIDPIKLEHRQGKDESCMNQIGVFVVSESPYYPKKEFGNGRIAPRFNLVNDQASRYYNLVKVKEEFETHGKADILLYIDDQFIWKKDAEKAGFIFVEAKFFANMFDVLHK